MDEFQCVDFVNRHVVVLRTMDDFFTSVFYIFISVYLFMYIFSVGPHYIA
jgi:hypothetical protein